MVNVFDVPKDIVFDEYTENADNEGKVAIVGDGNAVCLLRGMVIRTG